MEAEIADVVEFLLYARHSLEHFTVISFNVHNFMRKVVFLFSFYQGGNRGPITLRNELPI